MPTETLTPLVLGLLLLIGGASLLGQVAARLRQPKVVGEILAGVLLGPSLLGLLAPGVTADLFGDGDQDPATAVLGFLYHLGLLMLMFVAGASVRNVLAKENRRPTAWLLGLGTPLPFFLALGIAAVLPLDAVIGEAGSRPAVMLVIAIAAAVTSIPVISKIFYDLGILHTRFASLMLGRAVLEDIVLWGVLALATAIASATVASAGGALAEAVSIHVATNIVYIVLAMTAAPAVLRRLGRARWNVVASQAPIAWIMVVLLGYVATAAYLDVTLAFAAFLAGFGIVGGMSRTEHHRLRAPLDSTIQVSSAVFIPLYFAIVGFRLDFTRGFSGPMLVTFLVGSSVVVLLSIGLAARLAGFRGLDIANLAITCNARGGPGIVLGSVAFDAGIINAPFFTTLVCTAVLTSQACGLWLDFVLRKGWPLLSSEGPADLHSSSPNAPSTNAAARSKT
ncbi:Kef-type K+ transport system membrane component KefB [Kribbella antiqua]|uniref:Kef-type K+ transport system membrane component KefB n=1 Tax=Kribbella antiqua TaxID=2512217 RepID=A0A4V2S2Y8_9ACTN|nr:cation:proton antiporter [Kribbella antiqua]TCO42330.1 Kef-type K+ transport system membrane component KefB [Kribbella antiqua]